MRGIIPLFSFFLIHFTLHHLKGYKSMSDVIPVASVPGIVIDHIPASSECYIGSPSLAVMPDGTYVASHDIFGPGSGFNQTKIFNSYDQGRTWIPRSKIEGQFWSSLFIHKGYLYLMGTSEEYGNVIIRRSEDGGGTWTTPTSEPNGLLMKDAKYHCAPVPVVTHKGRIWRAMEDAMGQGGWPNHFRSFMMSAPDDSDPLRADSWIGTNRIERNADWLDGAFQGWLEGNAVVSPMGDIVNILRVDHPGDDEKAALVHISPDGINSEFDPQNDFIPFPGGCKKFTIRYDTLSKGYWALVNPVIGEHPDLSPGNVRNNLALSFSSDLRHWEMRSILLSHPDMRYHGFQYVDWLISGEDIIAVSRTAYDDGFGGAHTQHDANFMTFHRFKRFRLKKGL